MAGGISGAITGLGATRKPSSSTETDPFAVLLNPTSPLGITQPQRVNGSLMEWGTIPSPPGATGNVETWARLEPNTLNTRLEARGNDGVIYPLPSVPVTTIAAIGPYNIRQKLFLFSNTLVLNVIDQPNQDTSLVTFRMPPGIMVNFTLTAPGVVPVPWTNMPVASTEFLGLSQHRVAANFGILYTTMSLYVNVVTASTSATAILKLQFSGDQTTWFDTGVQVGINNTGLRNSGDVAVSTSGLLFFRLIGVNGNGAGDSPAFGTIGFIWKS